MGTTGTNRLLTRGLLVSGSGETEYDALYDLLGSLSIIPTSGPFFLRLASFVKLTLLAHVPVSAARKLFQKDKRTKYEALVMRLAGQALLSTAEIIKCIDKNISRLPMNVRFWIPSTEMKRPPVTTLQAWSKSVRAASR